MTSNEFDLAPSEKRPTYEFLSDSGLFFIELLCYRHKLQPICQGKGQLKIEENTSLGKLVKPFQIW